MRFWLRLVVSVISLLAAGPVAAQFPDRGGGGTSRDFPGNYSSEPQQSDFDIPPDTLSIFYFFADNPGEEFNFSDSLLGDNYQQFDPARQRDFDYATLGNLGSAARPLVYEPLYRRGFDVGLHQFDIYQTPVNKLPFYRLQRAYTNINYYQRAEQADSYITGQFSRNFAGGFNFTIDYRRINQLGRRNKFQHQNTRNTALATGLWYHSKGGRYDGFLALAWNTIEQEDNGGIFEEPESTEGFDSPNSAQVALLNPQTRHARRGVGYTHYFTLGPRIEEKPVAKAVRRTPLQRTRPGLPPGDSLAVPVDTLSPGDSLAVPVDTLPAADSIPVLSPDTLSAEKPAKVRDPNRRRYILAHQIQYQTNTYKFFDEDPANTNFPDYYGDFLVDTRGLRFFVRHKELENSFRLRSFKPAARGGSFAQQQRDLIELGILNRINWIDMEATDSTVVNLFAFGRIHFQPNERLRIRTYGQFGLLDHLGDYRVFGELLLGLGNFGAFTASFNNQLYEPNLMQSRFFVSEQSFWGNDFSKTLETNVRASLNIPRWRLELTAGYHLLNNYIYFDTLVTPQQSGVPISIVQFILKKDFTVGNLNLDNIVTFQAASENLIRLPGIYSKHSLYFRGKWFGVLNIRFGVDLRLNNSWQPPYYHPLVGQFIPQFRQAPQTIDLYPALDAFLSLRVTRFRAFVKWENMNYAWSKSPLYYQTAYYPAPTGSGFRIGLNWRFVD